MSRKPRQRDLDPLDAMRAANPVEAAELEIDDDELAREMGRAIAAGEAPSQPVPAGDRIANEYLRDRESRQWGLYSRRPLAFGLAAGLACIAAVAVLLLLGGGSVGGGHPSFAAAAIEVAEANPRLLVGAPGWAVTDAGEFEPDGGEVSFSDGEHRLSIHWYPARAYRSYLHDRSSVSRPERSTLLGRTATTVEYGSDPGAGEWATMLAPRGPVFLEIRAQAEDRAEYDAVLRSLHPVAVGTWLAAMPPNVVGPQGRAAVVERMLRGVPLPPSFDVAGLEGEDALLNHYQLAVRVAGAVSCGWVESWLAATGAGDADRARQAVDAMATWRRWPLTPALREGGGWSANVHQAARSLATGQVDKGPSGALMRPDGSGYQLGPAWAVMLNCRSHYWRHPIQP